MRFNIPLVAFSFQGDRVIGVSGLNGMAEECVIDQKVSLLGDFFSFFLFFNFLLSFIPHSSLSLFSLYSFGHILFPSQALLSFKC